MWFVDLAPLTEGIRVAETVAQLLGVREEEGGDLIDRLIRHVQNKRLLLVLDNCEHLLSASAMLADALLNASSEIRILATSQEGLGIDGERLLALRSLSVPSADAALNIKEVAAAEAVRLFLDRAQITQQSFVLTEGNAVAVAEICRHLDGIPLAIELAAARVRILSVEQIRAKLDDRFRLLTGGSKSALPRHQTLRAAIQWSYDQLSIDEQRLQRLLSVFAGGWTLNLATKLTGDGADEFEVMDLLGHLVDKSLVVVESGPDDEPRYGLLETVRHYSLERLTEAGEAAAVRKRHLDVFLNVAERAYAERIVHEQEWATVLESEIDNFRAALEIGRELDSELYLQLSGALAWFWQAKSHLREGREHLTAALNASRPLPARASQARALWGAAHTLSWQGDAMAALPWMEEALRTWRELGDLNEIALALEGIGWTQFLGGNHPVVCSGSCAQHGNSRLQPLDYVNEAPVIRSKVMTPVGNTVHFINYEKAYSLPQTMKHEFLESFVTQPFGRDHQDVAGIIPKRGFGRFPLCHVRAIDGEGSYADFGSRFNLVTH